jgi:ankyrin repeat protein
VRCLLDHPSAPAVINRRDDSGATPLWAACREGRGDVARLLLERGADPTIANEDGTTPMAIAKDRPEFDWVSAKARRDCVAALTVSSPHPPFSTFGSD